MCLLSKLRLPKRFLSASLKKKKNTTIYTVICVHQCENVFFLVKSASLLYIRILVVVIPNSLQLDKVK